MNDIIIDTSGNCAWYKLYNSLNTITLRKNYFEAPIKKSILDQLERKSTLNLERLSHLVIINTY